MRFMKCQRTNIIYRPTYVWISYSKKVRGLHQTAGYISTALGSGLLTVTILCTKRYYVFETF